MTTYTVVQKCPEGNGNIVMTLPDGSRNWRRPENGGRTSAVTQDLDEAFNLLLQVRLEFDGIVPDGELCIEVNKGIGLEREYITETVLYTDSMDAELESLKRTLFGRVDGAVTLTDEVKAGDAYRRYKFLSNVKGGYQKAEIVRKN